MLLNTVKSIVYRCPWKDTHVFHRIRMGVYHRIVRTLMQRNYGKVRTKKIHGITYELDLSEAIDSSLYYSGVYEFDTVTCLKKYVQPEMIVFEIGANIGSHSFEIARCLRPGTGTLYCFEPTTYAFRKLLKNHALNHFTNITFEQLALSDRETIQRLTPASSLDTMAFSASWDITDGQSRNTQEQTIVFDTLDHYIQQHAIHRVDLLKIDVDGYELKVINGGITTIATWKPVIIIELSACMLQYVGDTLDALLTTLQGLGYSFQPVYARQKMDRARLLHDVQERQSLDCLCRYEP